MLFRTFGWSFGVTAAGLVVALAYGGLAGLLTVTVLAVLEISLSFDNAVVNAKVLERMSAFWQKIFLTVGIAIAVFGMRLVFPLLIVGITARLGPVEAIELALNDERQYAAKLHDAYPMIAAFGGMFLLLLFLDFIFEQRSVTWLTWLERPLARLGELDQLSVLVASCALSVIAGSWAARSGEVMIAGVLGMATYLAVNGLGELFLGEEQRAGLVVATGRAAFFLFLYLEVLDASFSFDGVIGAFAISTDLVVIALGLGIGAMYIRSLTVFLVRKGTLHEYRYLEHGAHWAIGALAVCMLVGLGHEVPEVISGGLGAGFILAALLSSVLRNRREDGTESKELQPSNTF